MKLEVMAYFMIYFHNEVILDDLIGLVAITMVSRVVAQLLFNFLNEFTVSCS